MNISKTFLSMLVISASTCIAPLSMAQDMDQVLKALDDALPGKLIHNPLDIEWEKGGNDIKTKLVDAPELTSGQAVSVRIKKRQDKPWDSYLKTEISGSLTKGENVEVYYWVRTSKAIKGKDTANVTLFLGRNEEPYDYIISEDITPSSNWELKSVKGVAPANFSAGKIKLEYQLGRGSQIVEFGPIYVSRISD